MNYLLWSLPALTVAGAIGVGRLKTAPAAALGLAVAAAVAMLAGALPFGPADLLDALARGAWIGATLAPYIFGGLLFWQIAAGTPASGAGSAPLQHSQVRSQVFTAVFLVGPFAEAATGFGVGMLGTIAMLRPMRIAPRHLAVFALLSQTTIPWGGMSSGTLLAATYARVPEGLLALAVLAPTAILMAVWLPLFWRTARLAGMQASWRTMLGEAAWVALSLALLAVAVVYTSPEISQLAVYGPLILLRLAPRLVRHHRAGRGELQRAARTALPFALLIAALMATRTWPGLKTWLGAAAAIAPFADLPPWLPLLHAGSWLLAAGLLLAVLRGQAAHLPRELSQAWSTGRQAALSVGLFAMMAEVIRAAGIAHALAHGLFGLLDRGAINAAALLSSALGVLTNSGNMPNSLFMASQVTLAAQAGLGITAVAAMQHVAGTAMSFFSPVRMAIATSLAQAEGEQRAVYASLLGYAACALLLLQMMTFWVAQNGPPA